MIPDLQRLREDIDTHLDEGEVHLAVALLRELWQKNPGLAQAGFVNARYEKLGPAVQEKTFKVEVLRSFTVEPVIPLLKAAAHGAGLDLQVHLGDFNAYAQEILTPASHVYTSNPDLVILAVQTRDLVPELWHGFTALGSAEIDEIKDRTVHLFDYWLKTLRKGTQASILVHNLSLPADPSNGILDAQVQPSQGRTLRDINDGIADLARGLVGTYLLDWDGLVSRHGRMDWTDERKWLTARLPIAADRILPVAQEWMRFIHPLSGHIAKCLVCDLDNTLWGGVIGEDGQAGIQLGPDYPGAGFVALQRTVLDLYHRGVLLAICSKNNESDALQAIANHPNMVLRMEHFAAARINWEDKATNLRLLAKELNIGLDSLVLMDDSAPECLNVHRQLPMVQTLHLDGDPTLFSERLRGLAVFERLTLLDEDKTRSLMYASQRQRVDLEAKCSSLEDFYHSLAMRAEIRPLEPSSLARLAQLTQKTNQFNMTTCRYAEAELERFAADPSKLVWSIKVTDRFGDNGVVGLVMVTKEQEAWEIDNFLLSCRVIGRTLETLVLATLAEEAKAHGAKRLLGKFIMSSKNAPASEVYQLHGFKAAGTDGETVLWSLDLASEQIAPPPWIQRTTFSPGFSINQ